MPRPVLLALVLAGCTDNQLSVINTEPKADILLPVEGEVFVQGEDLVVLRGQVSDNEQDEDTLDVVWLSNVDGTLGDELPDADGVATLELPASDLSIGEHTLTLTVSDNRGENDSDRTTFSIAPPDEAPAVQIVSPADGASFPSDQEITLVGSAADARDPASALQYEWESDRDGVLDSGALSAEGEARFTTTLGEGAHTLTLRVLDTEDNVGEASVSVEVTHVNAPPSVAITSPLSGQSFRVGTTVTLTGTALDAEDDETALLASWWSDHDGELGLLYPDSAGGVSLSAAGLSVGLHTITLSAEDTEGASATASVSIEVYEANTPPGVPEIVILPSDPATDDDLEVVVLTEAEDEDGDPVSYVYQWYRDDALMSGYDTETVAAARTSKHETWKVEVMAFDGEDYGTAATAEVTIANSAPSILAATISPSSPTVADTLSCAASGWSDADGDAEGLQVTWTVDGEEVSTEETLSGLFSRGQVVGCALTPDDGEDTGEVVEAEPVTVGNTPPAAPVIAIDPAYPTSDDDLVVVEETAAYDADGDAITTSYTWVRDGRTTSRTDDTVPASATTVEESWTVTATVSDGLESASSDPVTVRIWPGEGDLLVTEFHPDPSAVADARGEFVEFVNTTDVDIDLTDHSLVDYDYDCVDLTGITLGAGEYLVVCVDGDSTVNGGIRTCDVIANWDTGYTSGCNQLALSNSGDEIAIENPAGYTDAVVYTSSWVRTGKATGLSPSITDPTDADSASAWCAQTSSLSGGDEATPGVENDVCR